MIGFAVVIGTFIGVVITWQTLQGASLANIKEFASLRAVGVSMGGLRLIVMGLGLWVGVAGLLLTAALTGVVWVLARSSGVPMDFPLFIDVPVAIALLTVAILSGALSRHPKEKSARGFAAMSLVAIDAKGLSKAYKIGRVRQQVLKNIDFTAHHGQVTMVMGPSGSVRCFLKSIGVLVSAAFLKVLADSESQ